MIEQDLINYNTVLNNPIDETLITAILNETTKNKNESEADILAYAISTLSSDSSQTTKTTVIMTSSHIMTRTSKKLKAVSSGSIKTRKDNGTSERTAAFGSSRPYHTQLPTD
jgi:Holliday junction resolvasome RuvABC endonuclease subunit